MKRRRTRGCVDFTFLPCHRHLFNTSLEKGIHERCFLSLGGQRTRWFNIPNPSSSMASLNIPKPLEEESGLRIREESISNRSHSFILYLASLSACIGSGEINFIASPASQRHVFVRYVSPLRLHFDYFLSRSQGKYLSHPFRRMTTIFCTFYLYFLFFSLSFSEQLIYI